MACCEAARVSLSDNTWLSLTAALSRAGNTTSPFPMAETPKVSILLPSLNAREFLQPRIASLFNQTFTDWEAIVLGSQSPDGTWELFKSSASTDPRFRLHQIPPDGLYAALNP